MNRKTIKVKFIGYWKGFDPEKWVITQMLRKHYDLQIVEDADYIICGCFEPYYEYCNYPQIRIFYCGENYIPDFNLVDYAICRYPVSLGDRNFYFPGCIDDGRNKAFGLRTEEGHFDKEWLNHKEYFANFISGHESEYGYRGEFFKKLCEYKRVESIGTYLNNMPNGKTISMIEKLEFQKKCKFTLCFESTKHEGFITEKITDAFLADTIPVYYGSSNVTDIFNEKAFINCSEGSFDEAIEKIIELDNDDEKYLDMINQKTLISSDYVSNMYDEFEKYLINIFEQPYEKAYRRCRVYAPMQHEQYLKNASKQRNKSFFEAIKNVIINR